MEAFGDNPDLKEALRGDLKNPKGIFYHSTVALRGASCLAAGEGVVCCLSVMVEERMVATGVLRTTLSSVSFGLQAGADVTQMCS